jgi:hypothetical protein
MMLVIMLSVVLPNVGMLDAALFHCYTECHYAECRYAESRGAFTTV